ncbi:ATP-dependent helicase [Candidatus Parcubacteria bacterium]|nr:MAG: ATP-dependent helicase [Candidatus Parcubacteria bacterium]
MPFCFAAYGYNGGVSEYTFQQYYRRLNPSQREAVDAVEGTVMVIAGPGTGKTQVLTLRIANILRRTQATPDSILALTFTESGAHAMRQRLVQIIGSPAYHVTVATFHGFCNEIIREYPEYFPRVIGATNITEAEQVALVRDILASSRLRKLKPSGDEFYYVRHIVEAMNELKREDIAPDEFGKIVARQHKEYLAIPGRIHEKGPYRGKVKAKFQKIEDRLARNEELAKVYRLYQKELARRRLYDYNDMIMEVLTALRSNGDLLAALQEQYHYFLADEHQDANRAQNHLLELLCSFYDDPNLFLVGDEKQAIFRFQGASLENFSYFLSRYPHAKVIHLTTSYRSPQPLLDAAHTLISAGLGKHVPLAAHVSPGLREPPLRVVEFPSEEEEARAVAAAIRRRLKEGIAPSEIAILYRDNKDAAQLTPFLREYQVPFVVESEEDILGTPVARKLVLLLEAVAMFGSGEQFIHALHLPEFGIEAADIFLLLAAAGGNPRRLLTLARSEQRLRDCGVAHPQRIVAATKKLGKWHSLAQVENLDIVLNRVLEESGLLAALLHSGSMEDMERLGRLFDEARRLVENHKRYTLEEFLRYLEVLRVHRIPLQREAGEHLRKGKVRLMTAHKAKGREFDYVYIIGAYDGHWGGRKSRRFFLLPTEGSPGSVADEDEERRLFYVALTRARRAVQISYARVSPEGRERMPSRFITDLKDHIAVESRAAAPAEEAAGVGRARFQIASPATSANAYSMSILRELFLTQGLSVTALNNYLRCPRLYLYVNLLRVPRVAEKTQRYGIAVHAALRTFFDRYREGQNPPEEFLLDLFWRHLQRQPFSPEDLAVYGERGRVALSGYYRTYFPQWHRAILNEFRVRGVQLTPEIRLVGMIDKIEFLDAAGSVNVVDYKTGVPRSRRAIEGTTKSSRGEYKRQLVFYKLLLERSSKRYRVVSGEIDFVEPTKSGKYRKERFLLSAEEVEDLERLVREVATEILSGEFLEKSCGDPRCSFCALWEGKQVSLLPDATC